MSRLAVLAAGGTGGHMFPAQALAEELLRRGWRVALSTDARGARYAGGFPEGVTVTRVTSATPARGGLAGRATTPFRIAGGVAGALAGLARARPSVVVGFGGYPTIPALSAALTLRVPAMIHEQNGVLGRVNALFAARVATVACGVWPTDLPAGALGVHTGNPVRGAVLARAASPYQAPGEGAVSLLVIGGSQGARILSLAMPEAVGALPEGLRARLAVAHQARAEDADEARAAYADAGVAAEVSTFFADVPDRLADAHLVISRAGASSVADIAAVGRPSILVPFAAAAGDHQSANARMLVEAGAAAVLSETELTTTSLTREITHVLGEPDRASAMARAALGVARPDAAGTLADLAVAVADRRTITATS